MKITQHIHQRIRLKNAAITGAIITLLIALAWLSQRYTTQIDLTTHASNTLSTASQKILVTLPEQIVITAYIKPPALQKQITQLISQYQRFKHNITLQFIAPDSVPETARELNIDAQGLILVKYKERTEKIIFLDESSLSNALLKLANTQTHWISFLSGHGERSPTGKANFDWGLFGTQLTTHKINPQTLNLAKINTIPDNSSLLVLASPATSLLSAELTIISDYIAAGGNLLLLTDPNNPYLAVIEQQLGISKLAGTIVDTSTGLYGIDDPSFVLISEYNSHPISKNFKNITVFPVSAALEHDEESAFQSQAILSSITDSWTETDAISGSIRFDIDSEEQQGPLTIAYALTREISGQQQRIIVMGDGDFLSNSFLGNVGNAELGSRMINWLIHDDQFIDIPTKTHQGKTLQLSTTAIAIIGVWFLLVAPLLLTITGFIIWQRRKRR